MSLHLTGLLITFLGMILLAIPLGRYIGKLYAGEATWSDRLFLPLETAIYRLSGIRQDRHMNWKQHLAVLLTLNLCWFLFSMLVLMNMGWLPLNPDANPSMSADLAFNTTISFISNTNLQHYSGETGVSYLGQMVLMLFQFISAAAGMAVCAVVFRAMKEKSGERLGNFYVYFVKSCTRILLPLSLLLAVILLFNGVPMTFAGKDHYISLQGDSMQVSRGPAAAMIAIKQLGTNGGGFFGVNSAHPLENPNAFTNILENISILLIPMALLFALGYMLKRRKFAWMIFGVMCLGFLLLLLPTVYQESAGNPAIAKMGIAQPTG
ncbi:MAG TPA: potassium-transporting ATPase subunit KdpA, partial [Sediminibacterium sp.]|nr:potassium-transporting ATPase subunit KdpA [Sediminibacterium sp.]